MAIRGFFRSMETPYSLKGSFVQYRMDAADELKPRSAKAVAWLKHIVTAARGSAALAMPSFGISED